MKITSRDKGLLFLMLSLAIVAVSYFIGARLINEKTAEIKTKKEELQREYDERVRILEKKEQYLKDTKDYNEAHQMLLTSYPAGITQERQIMFVVGLEERFQTPVVSVSYTEEQELYRFQSKERGNEEPYQLVSSIVQIPIEVTYEQWKEFLDYVFSYQDKNTIPSVAAEFDAAIGKVSATITLNQYAVKGGDRTLEAPKITVPIGTGNVFLSGTPLSYDGGRVEQIEAIKKDYDCFVMLYPAASDVKAKVIAGAGEIQKLISESNEEELLTITAMEEAGTSSITYALGEDRPRVLKGIDGDTLDIYVLSSPRMGMADLSSVRVRIDNQTEKNMRIAITGEDTKRPRFQIEEQDGKVELLREPAD